MSRLPARWVAHSARLLDGTGAPALDDAWLVVEAGRVAALGSGDRWREHARGAGEVEVLDATGRWLVPGFVDVHRHGGGGRSHEEGPDAVLAAALAHRAHGSTAGVVSFVADDVDVLAEHLSGVADLVEAAGGPGGADGLLLGSHLEGPFLAHARRGAHDPAKLADPTPAAVRHLLAAARGTLRQVTLDPQRTGAHEALRLFAQAGTAVAVGHTEATCEQAAAAFDAGARLLTHAFNAMPGIHHRAPGPVVAALDDERVVLEVILDGHHVHPRAAALLLTAAPGRVALVTDAMAAAAVAPGGPDRYRLGGLEVVLQAPAEPGTPPRAVLAGGDTIAGSALTLDVAVRLGVAAGVPLEVLVRAATSTPARAVGAAGRGVLAPGARADVVVLDEDLAVVEVRTAGSPA